MDGKDVLPTVPRGRPSKFTQKIADRICSEFPIQVYKQGQRCWFPPGTPNKKSAAAKAAEIYCFIQAHGWSAALEKYKPKVPVLTFTSRTGTFALGIVSTDSLARPASAYGTFALQHSSTAVNLTWTPRPLIEQWRYTWFAVNTSTGNAADLADPYGDGESNLLEFATAQNPLAATLATPSLVKNGASLEFTCTRSIAALNDATTFTVEGRDPLTTGASSSAGVTE